LTTYAENVIDFGLLSLTGLQLKALCDFGYYRAGPRECQLLFSVPEGTLITKARKKEKHETAQSRNPETQKGRNGVKTGFEGFWLSGFRDSAPFRAFSCFVLS
jgi:hypothetical protein